MYYPFGCLDTIVSQVMSQWLFNHNDGMLLYKMGVRATSSFSYLDIALSSVITLYLFATMTAGYSILRFYPVEYLTFDYVRVAHWATTDGWPQRWT